MFVHQAEQVYGRDVPTSDMYQPSRLVLQQMRNTKVFILRYNSPIHDVCDSGNLHVCERRTAAVFLDVPGLVPTLSQMRDQPSRQLLIDEKPSHTPQVVQAAMRWRRADASNAANSRTARMSSRSSSS